MLTDIQLRQIMPNLAAAKLALYLAPLNAAMQAYGVNTMLRTAAFIAQLAHESGEFRWMEEIWGPTDAQRRYEPPNALAAKLGNTQAGDGKRFKGRGPIQITGRFNYKKYGDQLGIDLTAEPERAGTPDIGFAPKVEELVASSAAKRGLKAQRIVSGAGHDCQELAKLCPAGMVFVPGEYDGISHNPREFSTPKQCADGVNVLLDVLMALAEEEGT